MVTEFDLPCTRCGGEITPVAVPEDEQQEDEAEPVRLGECVECGATHYPESIFDQE